MGRQRTQVLSFFHSPEFKKADADHFKSANPTKPLRQPLTVEEQFFSFFQLRLLQKKKHA
jgi:hypothetical protein